MLLGQLALTRDVLASNPGPLLIQIKDNTPGRASPLAPHVLGGVPVAPYVPFASDAVVVDPYGLTLDDRDGDGSPDLSLLLPGAPASAAAAVASAEADRSSAQARSQPTTINRKADEATAPIRRKLRR